MPGSSGVQAGQTHPEEQWVKFYFCLSLRVNTDHDRAHHASNFWSFKQEVSKGLKITTGITGLSSGVLITQLSV